MQCQLALDQHLQVCAACDTLGPGPYCSACGVPLAPEMRLCDHCRMAGHGAYCTQCGAVLRSHAEEAIEAGTFDWEAWAQSLQPFLGGLTPQEQALLQQDGMTHGSPSSGDYGL
jgi:hypothetical protein